MSHPPQQPQLERLNKAIVWFLPSSVVLILLGFFLVKRCSREQISSSSSGSETLTPAPSLPVADSPFPYPLPKGSPPAEVESLSTPLAMAQALRAAQARKFDLAIWCFAHVWKFNPKTRDLFYHLGTIALRQNDLTRGRELLEKSLALGEQKVACHNLLGLYFQEQGQLDAAQDHFMQALQTNGSDAQSYFNLGELFRKKNQRESALENLGLAAKLKPQNPYFSLKLRLALIAFGQPGGLAEKTKLQLMMEPQSADWLMTSAALALKNHDVPHAVRDLNQVKSSMNGGLFQHLLKDEAFQPYATLPEIAPFYPAAK